MKEFDEWQKTRSVKTIGFLDSNSAYKAGEREGWKMALEWIRVKVENYTPEDVCYFIDEELEQ